MYTKIMLRYGRVEYEIWHQEAKWMGKKAGWKRLSCLWHIWRVKRIRTRDFPKIVCTQRLYGELESRVLHMACVPCIANKKETGRELFLYKRELVITQTLTHRICEDVQDRWRIKARLVGNWTIHKTKRMARKSTIALLETNENEFGKDIVYSKALCLPWKRNLHFGVQNT